MNSTSNIPEVMFGIGDKNPRIESPYFGIPLEELETPKNGYICIMDRWWVVAYGQALFYEGGYPQCNINERIAEYLADPVKHPDLPKRVSVVFIPLAYVKPRS